MDGSPRGRSGRWLIRAFPRAWRDRYGVELLALLEDHPPSVGDRIDLLRAALDAHLHPGVRSRVAGAAALVAGAGWAVVAIGALAGPTPLDWPGYDTATLLPAAVAAGAGWLATVALAVRLADGPPYRWRPVATGIALAGQLALTVALAVAALGGPYGPITGAMASVAGVGLIAMGLVALRIGPPSIGVALLLVGGAGLVPPPVGFVLAAAAWTGAGLWLLADRVPALAPR